MICLCVAAFYFASGCASLQQTPRVLQGNVIAPGTPVAVRGGLDDYQTVALERELRLLGFSPVHSSRTDYAVVVHYESSDMVYTLTLSRHGVPLLAAENQAVLRDQSTERQWHAFTDALHGFEREYFQLSTPAPATS